MTHEETEWFRIVAWNTLAEVCNAYLTKGSRVYVEGRLQTRTWRDQAGQERSIAEVIAAEVIMLDARLAQPTPDTPEPVDQDESDVPQQPQSPAAATQRGRAVPRAPRRGSGLEREDLPL